MRRLVLLLAALLLVPLTAPAATAGTLAYAKRIELPNGFAPEGIEAGAGTTVYVGSLADGSIWRGDVRTGRGSVWVPGVGTPTLGLAYDAQRRLLWAAGGPSGQVRVYSTDSGALVRTYTFAGAGFLNDLTITERAVYVTDSLVPRLAVLPLREDGALPETGRTLPLTGEIDYVPGDFNANGIVDARGFLILAQSARSQLFRVNPMTGLARRIDAPRGAITSPDGLELRGRSLYVVRNAPGRVAQLRLSADLLSATAVDQLTGDTDYPSTATFVRGALFVVNARFATAPGPTTAYWISRVS